MEDQELLITLGGRLSEQLKKAAEAHPELFDLDAVRVRQDMWGEMVWKLGYHANGEPRERVHPPLAPGEGWPDPLRGT